MTTKETRRLRTGRAIGRAAAAALVIGTVVVGSGPARARAAGAKVPFTAEFRGQIAFTGETTTAWSGVGVALHLGTAAGAGSMAVIGPDESCPGGLANVNTATLTGANGDTLTLTSIDVACPISGYELHGTGHWTVAGGTGRFASATGQGSVVGDANFATGAFTVTWTGSLAL